MANARICRIGEGAEAGRRCIWPQYSFLFMQHPLIGVGLTNYQVFVSSVVT